MLVCFSIYCLRDNAGVSWVSVESVYEYCGRFILSFCSGSVAYDRDTHTHLIVLRGG